MITPERWQKVKDILNDALALAPSERGEFLATACAGDEALLKEVESFIEFDRQANSFIETPAYDLDAVTPDGIDHDAYSENKHYSENKQVGPYRIVRQIGRGGMGAVYLATRSYDRYEKQVAVKVIKRGMDTDFILRRFLGERKILASLDHPNIARLLDGGSTEDGLPYIVMEYVEGRPITEYSDAERLTTAERLKLFRQVCAAVHYAHQNLVVHRDIKPSNILVAKDGTPKLLDFGIAKLLAAESDGEAVEATATGMRMMTLDYASPEQIKGEPITTASDIYSLGILLYELLTGHKPYRTKGRAPQEVIRAVLEEEPTRPSTVIKLVEERATAAGDGRQIVSPEAVSRARAVEAAKLRRQLAGDLDNIALKALRKEPARRYSSVEQFAEDIRRHLEGLPVRASKDTFRYRASKFVRRNRASVAFGTLVVITLLGGIAGTTWQARRAERNRASAELERERAERRFESIRGISNSMVSEIERAIRDLPGSLPARQLLLTRAVEQLDELARESEGNVELQLDLVWAYQNIGSLPDRKLSETWDTYQKALALTEQILAARPADRNVRDRLAMVYLDMIYVARMRGDVGSTLEYNKKAVSIVDSILRDAPEEPKFQDSFWTANYHYLQTMYLVGNTAEGAETARKILPVAEELYRTEPPGTDKYNFMKPHLTRYGLGYCLSYSGEYQAAASEFQTALAACQAEQVKRPNEDILRRNEANIRFQLAALLENVGDSTAALEQAQTALSMREKLSAGNPHDYDFLLALAEAELSVAEMLARQNQHKKSLSRFRRALSLYEKLVLLDGERVQPKILAARTRAGYGGALASIGETAEGLRHLREAVRFYEEADAANTLDAHLKRYFAESCSALATALVESVNIVDARQGIYNEARVYYGRSLQLWQALQRQGALRYSDSSRPEALARRLNELDARL
jgi:serine/threonine protein kinase